MLSKYSLLARHRYKQLTKILKERAEDGYTLYTVNQDEGDWIEFFDYLEPLLTQAGYKCHHILGNLTITWENKK